MIEFRYTGDELYGRMERAVEKVNQRLRRTVEILENAKLPYAIVGGHAVRAWVAQVDEAATRTTRDVDVLIRPKDLPAVRSAMEAAGFHYRQTMGLNMFTDHPDSPTRDAVHIVMCGEMVRPDDIEPNPDIEPGTRADRFRTLTLEQLVRMKLNSFRRKDQVHLLDMIEVGLIDRQWTAKFPPALAERLQELLDDPDG
ncbi:MAG: hypothetical protein KDA60_09275 [Planctomycetales bacterium]|nr:hypothetical protein [Planctomycetales bacterium]